MQSKAVIRKFLHDYFIGLDEPPSDRLLVPEDKIIFESGDIATAVLIYIYKGNTDRVHKAKIRFDASRLDKIDFDTNYEYIKDEY